jgi:hypothetical protein
METYIYIYIYIYIFMFFSKTSYQISPILNSFGESVTMGLSINYTFNGSLQNCVNQVKIYLGRFVTIVVVQIFF